MISKFLILFFILAGFSIILPGAALAQNATLYFSPVSGIFEVGQSFWLDVMVNTSGERVNAVAAYFPFPEDKLDFLGVNVNVLDSSMTIWAEKEAKDGVVRIAGGSPTPGFSGIKKLASVGFKAKVSSGSVIFKLTKESAVLTDAENKNILSLANSGIGSYNFKAKSVAAPQPVSPAPTPAPPVKKPQPPVIFEVEFSKITQNEVVISWKTDQDADSAAEYGTTEEYGFSAKDERLVKEHSFTISDLSPGTFYHFRVESKTAYGLETQGDDFSFSTLETPPAPEKGLAIDSMFILLVVLSVIAVGLCAILIIKVLK